MNKLVKLFRLLQYPLFLKALVYRNIAAGVEHFGLFEYLSGESINTIVDIGANRGQFVLVAHKYFPSAKIYSFEPLIKPARIFRRMFANDQGVVLHEVAIGSNVADALIHVSSADDSSSLLPITTLQNKLFPGTMEVETCYTKVKPLDHILTPDDLKKVTLLKIDVQGFEIEVLKGCNALLNKISYIYVECSFQELYQGQALADEVISFLIDNNFLLCGVYNLSYDKSGVAIQGDFLFKNRRNF